MTPNHATVARVDNGVPDSLVQCLLQGITQILAISLRTGVPLARPGRKQATVTEDFEFHISY